MTKDQLIDKYRDINVEHTDWWGCTYDNFKEDMGDIGIRVDDIYFSGFSSQGDGACFEGTVDHWELFLKSLGYVNHVLVQHAAYAWSFRVSHSGHYYHENCTRFDGDLAMPDGYDNDRFVEYYCPHSIAKEPLRGKAWLAVIESYSRNNFEQEFTDAFKDHMRRLYEQLEAEYDYLTSDEVVWDTIVANELDDITEEDET
jgi:hypothetical protein